GSLTHAPISWIFEGSMDGVEWIVLDKIENQPNWELDELREFEFDNDTSYQMYRLNCILSQDNTNYLSVNRLDMMALINPSKPERTPSWKTVSTTLPTSQQFQEE